MRLALILAPFSTLAIFIVLIVLSVRIGSKKGFSIPLCVLAVLLLNLWGLVILLVIPAKDKGRNYSMPPSGRPNSVREIRRPISGAGTFERHTPDDKF